MDHRAPPSDAAREGDAGDGEIPGVDLPREAGPLDGEPGDTAALDAVDAAPEDGAPEVLSPWPVPWLDEEPSPICPEAAAETEWFQFLDNLCDEKVWPEDTDRDRACPVADDSPFMALQDGTVVEYRPSSEPVVWDTTSLGGLLPEGMRMVVILVKRVNGVPHYRYLSNGTHDVAMQPWSTTKILAAANAAATLRIQSGYTVGLTATAGAYPVGDLVTSLCNYDHEPFSSNALGAWFHNVGGRAKANGLIHDLWLERPPVETFGGNYGEAAPGIPYTFVEPGGASVTVTPDTASGFSNNLSLFTLAEALKRLALHREEPTQRLPGIQWPDLRVLFFGAEGSVPYGPWGGMSADTAIYLQAGHDIGYIAERSLGRWRILSKLGLGTQYQFIHLGYACWPALLPDGQPVPGLGREFIVAGWLAQGGGTWTGRDRLFAKAYRRVILRIVDGRL
ncbi:MAG: hypothetical protein FJ098_05530 [Deltaproteobacteria bacterium]|nr:hypothetical protein [Deltaproteobacteria bacterium]